MKSLSFDQLTPGMEIIDEDGHTGIIASCKDIDAVLVKLTCCCIGSYVYYCLNPENKKHFEKIYQKES